MVYAICTIFGQILKNWGAAWTLGEALAGVDKRQGCRAAPALCLGSQAPAKHTPNSRLN